MATYMRARARRCGTVASLCPRGALSYVRRVRDWYAAATWQTSPLRGKAQMLRPPPTAAPARARSAPLPAEDRAGGLGSAIAGNLTLRLRGADYQ